MNDQIAISVTIPSVSHKGKFFVLEPSFWGNGKVSGIEIANEKNLGSLEASSLSRPMAIQGSIRKSPI
ncbi:hypothetical protein [Xanthomonas hortorum]|uniref:hypothetical protein n=1 Tax=Xanthomonas hortorum TaxID=56454 RepID=UPI0021141FE5|nr:hypothetical protein [Xanthomonas hortorum]UUF00189.1 hypothetical protein NDY24_11285 [Xanthomonas hortorum pv. pelargonii]UUF00661.1 hypothetical protein NDY25_11515 [Xanthomonas hortorum pv. pelargonii]UXN00467.1 hypothetical protein N8D55_01510 [Xanthomonas hortorum pv. pelargonii]